MTKRAKAASKTGRLSGHIEQFISVAAAYSQVSDHSLSHITPSSWLTPPASTILACMRRDCFSANARHVVVEGRSGEIEVTPLVIYSPRRTYRSKFNLPCSPGIDLTGFICEMVQNQGKAKICTWKAGSL